VKKQSHILGRVIQTVFLRDTPPKIDMDTQHAGFSIASNVAIFAIYMNFSGGNL